MSEDNNTEARQAEEQKINMRYTERDASNPDVGAVKQGEVYPVDEALAKRLLISHGWEPGDEAAQAFADEQGKEAESDDADAPDLTGQEAADNGHQEGQTGLGDSQHVSEGDPEQAVGEKGAGTGLEPGTGVPDEEAVEEADPDGDGDSDEEANDGREEG